MATIPELQEVLNENAEERTVTASDEFISLYQVFQTRYQRFQDNISAAGISGNLKRRALEIVNTAFENAGFTPEELQQYITTGLTITTGAKPTESERRAWDSLTAAVNSLEKLGEQFMAETSA